jgi:predicted kinase
MDGSSIIKGKPKRETARECMVRLRAKQGAVAQSLTLEARVSALEDAVRQLQGFFPSEVKA